MRCSEREKHRVGSAVSTGHRESNALIKVSSSIAVFNTQTQSAQASRLGGRNQLCEQVTADARPAKAFERRDAQLGGVRIDESIAGAFHGQEYEPRDGSNGAPVVVHQAKVSPTREGAEVVGEFVRLIDVVESEPGADPVHVGQCCPAEETTILFT